MNDQEQAQLERIEAVRRWLESYRREAEQRALDRAARERLSTLLTGVEHDGVEARPVR